MSVLEQLERISSKSFSVRDRWDGFVPSDELSHLTEDRRAGWRRILSSVLSAERLEKILILPLVQHYSEQKEICRFFEAQSSDEERHQGMIEAYLKNCHHYERKKKTLANQIFLDAFLKPINRLTQNRPLFAMAFLHLFEGYGNQFYSIMRRCAERDRLHGLLEMFKRIEKDELRHTVGLETLLRWQVQETRVSRLEIRGVSSCIRIFSLDANLRWWALHNREVRTHAIKLGIDPDHLTDLVNGAVSRTQEILRRAYYASKQ